MEEQRHNNIGPAIAWALGMTIFMAITVGLCILGKIIIFGY